MGYGYIAFCWLSSAAVVALSFNVMYPRYRRIATHCHHNSPTDLYTHRYDNRVLSVMLSGLFIFSSIAYILAQVFAVKGIIKVPTTSAPSPRQQIPQSHTSSPHLLTTPPHRTPAAAPYPTHPPQENRLGSTH